jgi:hypothetical protein
MSRMAAVTSGPSGVSSGLRLISAANSESVLAQAVQIDAGAHRAGPWCGEVAVAKSGVPAPVPLRHQHLDGLAQELLASIAEQPLGLGVDQHDAPGPVDDHHGVGCGLEQPAELLLGLLAIGDVADRARHQRPLIGLEGRQADLDRELAAVATTPAQLEPRAHRARPGRRREGVAVSAVPLAEPVGQQDLDPLPEQLGARVPEHGLGERVDQDDGAGAVDDHDGVGCRLEEPAKLCLGALLLDEGAIHLAEIAGDHREPCEATAGAAAHAPGDLGGEGRAVAAAVQRATLPGPRHRGVGDAVCGW